MTWDETVSKGLNMACFPHYRMFLCLSTSLVSQHVNAIIKECRAEKQIMILDPSEYYPWYLQMQGLPHGIHTKLFTSKH